MPLYDYGPWLAYTPTISSGAGTLTSASASGRYRKVGTTVHYVIAATITTNGTGSSTVRVTLPFSARTASVAGTGRGSAVYFGQLMSFTSTSSNLLGCVKYDGTYPGADGATFTVNGTYEMA